MCVGQIVSTRLIVGERFGDFDRCPAAAIRHQLPNPAATSASK
jgi:hypothetical protein